MREPRPFIRSLAAPREAFRNDAARGLPRAVNNIATQALAARKNIADEQSARTAVNEITAD